MEDFIGRYECSLELCDEIIQYYNENKELHQQGVAGYNVDKLTKDSVDLLIEQPNIPIIFEKYQSHLFDCLQNYSEKYDSLKTISSFGLTEQYQIQKYPIGGGFKDWHQERDGSFNYSIKRILVFMTYLNDLDDGGTMFRHLNLIEKAEKGKTLIFSADWFHNHKGQISQTKEKTIITGWYSHIW
tara:strand:- start:228 stop:782 length:555 start_codon:yes stop_codon:yes gene_type:complete